MVVIDANAIVSFIVCGLYYPDSPPGQALDDAAEGRIVLCAPESVREELERVLREVLDYSEAEVGYTLRALPIDWIERAVYEDLARARAPMFECAFGRLPYLGRQGPS